MLGSGIDDSSAPPLNLAYVGSFFMKEDEKVVDTVSFAVELPMNVLASRRDTSRIIVVSVFFIAEIGEPKLMLRS